MTAWFKSLKNQWNLTWQRHCLCMVITEQEGAEIWLNDRNTHLTTPRAVAVPRNTEVKLTLKLFAHQDHTAYVKSGHHLSYYHVTLQRVPLQLVVDNTRGAQAAYAHEI